MITLVLDQKDLTPEQQSHVNAIAAEFSRVMAKKYAKGQAEHGGNLWEVADDQLLDNAIEEALDMVVYLLTIRSKRRGLFAPPGSSQR